MMSVVIPAHNEADVIGRCLRALPISQLEVVVICNGCTDGTAAEAASVHPDVRVEQIDEASKTAALNRGDEVATTFPRLYLDADTVLEPGAIDELESALQAPGTLAASPTVEHDLSKSSPAVRSYYRIWSRLPSVGGDIVGCGAYVLSARGRARFDTFPDLLGDDHFVRDCFASSERRVAMNATSVVAAPRTVRALVRRKVRVYTGNRLVYRVQPGGRRRGQRRQAEWLGVVRRDPARVLDVPAYLAVTVLAKALSRWHQRRGTHMTWGRDDSTRQSVAE